MFYYFPQKYEKVNKIHSKYLLLSLKPAAAQFVMVVDCFAGYGCVCVHAPQKGWRGGWTGRDWGANPFVTPGDS